MFLFKEECFSQAFFVSLLSSFFLRFSRREHRQAGRVSGVQNLFLPFEFTFPVDFVNDCEKRCLHTEGCSYYEFDCRLSHCRLQRLNSSQEQNFVQNDRYITGTALLPADDDFKNGIRDACSTADCCPLLSIAVYCCLLLSIVVHCCP